MAASAAVDFLKTAGPREFVWVGAVCVGVYNAAGAPVAAVAVREELLRIFESYAEEKSRLPLPLASQFLADTRALGGDGGAGSVAPTAAIEAFGRAAARGGGGGALRFDGFCEWLAELATARYPTHSERARSRTARLRVHGPRLTFSRTPRVRARACVLRSTARRMSRALQLVRAASAAVSATPSVGAGGPAAAPACPGGAAAVAVAA